MACGCKKPSLRPPVKGPSEYIPSATYPDRFPHRYLDPIGPLFPPGPCCRPGPFPVPDTHTPDIDPAVCPPKIYRNPPDVIVLPGDNTTVETDSTDPSVTTYTVNAEAAPLVIDEAARDVIYGDGTPGNPLGIAEFDGVQPGTVPAALDGDSGKFLRGDGTWAEVENTRECSAAEMDEWLAEVE